ncbi:MAG TPA: diacylglycerol kinase family protein [Thermoleophilaceae bacterium]|nr:diacylglycerol kinase family protein [Thermoleophilaceae bacterium]
MSAPIALLANPSAADGRSLKCLDIVRAEFEAHNIEYEMATPSGRDAARQVARDAAERGQTVAAVGGDGTIGLIAGALRGTPGRLLVIPAGRGNDFARVLKIPSDPAAAARLAFQGHERTVDVGEVDGESFVCIASYGFDSDANRIANEAKLVKGNLVYLYAALRAVIGWKHATFRVTVDGQLHELRGWSVGVCNSNAYGGGMYAAPHAELDDGKFDVIACLASSKLTFLSQILPRVFKGTHIDHPLVVTFRGEAVEVSADRPFEIYADGDPIGSVPATVSISPRSLNVLVPAGA